MTVTMSGLITRAALFLYIFILHDSVVMGAVIVSAPSPLVGRVHKDSIPLECTFWSTDGTEVVATMTWTKQTVHGRKFRQLLEVQIPMSDDADVRYRDSSLIQRSNLSMTTGIDGKTTVRLMIIPTCTDEGLYRCSVTVPGVTNPPTALVNVTLLENPEVFSLTQLGEFRCMAALGNPAGRLQWVMVRRKGNRLRNITMGGMTSQQESSNYCYPVSKSILHVDVTGNDEKIICKVTRGTTTSSRELAISVPFPVRNVKIFSNIGGKQMAYWVKDMAAYSGDAVILNCSAKGRPAPDYTWRLWRENAWVMMNTSGRSALVIDGISKNTSGKYSCTAENRVGGAVHSHSKEIYLSVKGRLEDVTHATPKTKTSPHTIIMIIIFVGVVVVVTTVGVCVLIYCTMIKRRAKRRRKPISSVELEYQPVVRRPSRRFSSDLVPPRARDDFRI